MRDLRVRTKVLLVLTIPLLGFLGLAGIQVVTSVRTAIQLDSFARQVAVGRQIDDLVHELQRERDGTMGGLAALEREGTARDLTQLSPDQTAVDRAVVAFDTVVRPLTDDTTFARAYQRAKSSLSELPAIRDGAKSGWLRELAVFDAYTRIIADLHAMLLVPAAVAGDASLAQAVRAFANASKAKELAARMRGILFGVASAGRFEPGDLEAVIDIRAQQSAAEAQFADEAGVDAVAIWDDAQSGQASRTVSRLQQTMIDNAESADLGVDPQQWWQASTTQLERLRGAEAQLLQSATAIAEVRSAQERRSGVIATLLSALLLLIALLTSLAIGRLMVRSLQSLRAQALEVAQRTLPRMIERLQAGPAAPSSIRVEPIAVRSADEVGEVAEAFTAVHRSAVRLAAEQATMRRSLNAIHVRLARRSQALVDRQLRLLDEMESAEIEPDQLANLFLLDHLATRMRRNDENLLVLAGGDGDRRWTQPIPLATIVLAAAAEIEQYARVRQDITGDVHIVGHAVADVVHLVAELLENATVFSPPETTVTVQLWATPASAATLVISDEGMGMSPAALAKANRQIAMPGNIDVAAAERMGLVVVGHLARRQGVRVQLRPGERGVAVVVELPAQLLAEAPSELVDVYEVPATRRIAGNGSADEPLALRAGPGRGTDLALVGPAPGDARRSGVASTRRGIPPSRAEDVLSLGHVDSASLWWSRQPGAAGGSSGSGGARSTTVPAARAPLATEATGAGLPRRVPMAQLPATGDHEPVRAEADPDEVGNALSSFYGGVHRAAMEDADMKAET